jgi:hypothetical protein
LERLSRSRPEAVAGQLVLGSKKSVPKIESEQRRRYYDWMAQLLRAALDAVRDADAPHGLRAAAVTTLLAAFEHDLDVPSGSVLAVWKWLSTVGGDSVRFSRLTCLPGAEVVLEAVLALKNPDAGEVVQDLAGTVIEKSKHLSVISDADVLALVDGEPGLDRARRLVWVVDAVHRGRGLPSSLIQALRDRWSRSQQAHLRESSLEIAGLLSGLDEPFVRRMLSDDAPGVRCAVVTLLEQAEGDDRDRALCLLQKQLATEDHARVRSELHSAIGALLRTKSR